VCVPSFFDTKYRYSALAGLNAASSDDGPGFEIGPGGRPVLRYVL
jgi:hypothetical protein